MPIYEYECQVGHRFERRQSFHDEPLRECVECGQPARRLLSPAGIIFKGSGWYKTDSRPAPSTSDNGSSSSTSASEGSSTKSESTTATKSETPTAAAAD